MNSASLSSLPRAHFKAAETAMAPKAAPKNKIYGILEVSFSTALVTLSSFPVVSAIVLCFYSLEI